MASETWICIGLQNWDNGISLVTAEIVSINPLIPQSWGTSKSGGHPQTLGRKYPAPLLLEAYDSDADYTPWGVAAHVVGEP
jgi:hypothetical protein